MKFLCYGFVFLIILILLCICLIRAIYFKITGRPLSKLVYARQDGMNPNRYLIRYANGFTKRETVEPGSKRQAQLQQLAEQIEQENKALYARFNK